jgi:hypothetical protein
MALENILVDTDVEGVRMRSLSVDGASVHFRIGCNAIPNTPGQPARVNRRNNRTLLFWRNDAGGGEESLRVLADGREKTQRRSGSRGHCSPHFIR